MPASVAPPVEVRRSARRRRTVSAYREKDVVVVLIPARFSRAEEARWVDRMVAGVLAREERARQRGPKLSDDTLMRRASELNQRYLRGEAQPATVRWVANMEHRWGSCTPADRSIRISARLKQVPEWVLDYVLIHELAHLLAGGHDAAFWSLVNRYERTERARGYLEGYAAASRTPMTEDDSADPSTEIDPDPDIDPESGADIEDLTYVAAGPSSSESESVAASAGGDAGSAAIEPGALF
jgi:predicted metal-dependent hydrolase